MIDLVFNRFQRVIKWNYNYWILASLQVSSTAFILLAVAFVRDQGGIDQHVLRSRLALIRNDEMRVDWGADAYRIQVKVDGIYIRTTFTHINL